MVGTYLSIEYNENNSENYRDPDLKQMYILNLISNYPNLVFYGLFTISELLMLLKRLTSNFKNHLYVEIKMEMLQICVKIHDHLYLALLLFSSRILYHVYVVLNSLQKLRKKRSQFSKFQSSQTERFEVQHKHAIKSKNIPCLHLLPHV